ncbi:MAG: TauD/TfdA family dioxygenase [Gammaproteobacteria bacterium]|nr:TauD/TfdA family dioxygenase [Gammaproteobacteria bacterium]
MYNYYEQYHSWMLNKQEQLSSAASIIKVAHLENVSLSELYLIEESMRKFNYAIYQVDNSLKFSADSLNAFAMQFGLTKLDSHLCSTEDKLTKLSDCQGDANALYIPYTNRAINWHTDGYYNLPDQQILSLILHCQQPASSGGENEFLDHEQVFIHLMNTEPDYISALIKDDVMTIPENRQQGLLHRPEVTTSIFQILNKNHDVLMRYSQRKKNISFKQDTLTQEAIACLNEFINSEAAPKITIKLKAGQGILANNVLHKRTAFKDKEGLERVYYRARYYERLKIELKIN